MQSLQSPALAQSLDEEHLSPQAIVTGSSVLTGSSFIHLCWQIPSMHNLQSPAVAQSELEEQASPQTAPKKGTSWELWKAHLCWQVPSIHNLQVPASAQSEDDPQLSPHWAAKVVPQIARANATAKAIVFLIISNYIL